MGMLGTGRAQYHLRQSCVFLNMYPLNQPEVMVAFAQEKIDANGLVTDSKTRGEVGGIAGNLVAWTEE